MTQHQSNSAILRRVATLGAIVGLACACGFAAAQDSNSGSTSGNNVISVGTPDRLSPLANTAVGSARVIIPDGTSVFQGIGVGETRWFAFGIEPGKTYTVEVLDPYGDLTTNFVGTVGLFASNGTSVPPETQINCSLSTRAPSLEVSTDGVRCVIRAFTPDGTTQNKRGVFLAVSTGGGTGVQVRVRESTIYGRWTTNGYDYHVELQNTTGDSVCVQVLLYRDTGLVQTAGVWPAGHLLFTELTVPAFGAIKTVFPAGSAATPGAPLKGTLRLHACSGGPQNFNAGSIVANTYAYNPVTATFISMANSSAINSGATNNTW